MTGGLEERDVSMGGVEGRDTRGRRSLKGMSRKYGGNQGRAYSAWFLLR